MDADSTFGADDLQMKCLTDTAGLLRYGDRLRVEMAMDKIMLRFPQVFVAVYTGSLGEVANIRQFGFWLLNRAAFEDVPLEKPNEAGILLTIDPSSKAAGMVFGYLLDPFLSESDTFECLSRAHPYWLEGRYADGIIRALYHLDRLLRKRCRHARRDPEHYLRKVTPPAKIDDLVRKIRAGHRPLVPNKEESEEAKL
jgi:hypothetical protein